MASIINAATSGGLISTADTSGILQLQTASTTAVTVDASQNVGIGTSSPTRKLSIAGTSTALMDFTPSSFTKYTVGSESNGFVVYDEAASAYRLVINSSGNVGIGISSPGTKLTVNTASANTAIADFADSAGIGLFAETSSGIPIFGSRGGSQDLRIKAGQNLQLYANSAERARIDSSGNLLVGGTSQSGTANRTAVFSANKFGLSVIDTTAQAAGVGGALNLGGNYRSAGDAQAFARVSAVKQNSTDTDYGYGMAFSVTPNGGTFTEAGRIDSSGNLLVGTTSFTSGTTVSNGIFGGNFRSVRSNATIPASSTATVMTLSSSVTGVYIVNANFGATGNAIYGGMLIVVANAGSFRIVTNGGGSSSALSMSGANVQITNALGSPLDAVASAIFIGN